MNESSPGYKKNKLIIKTNNGMVSKWVEAVVFVKTFREYEEEGLNWSQFCQKYIPDFTIQHINRLIAREVKQLPAATCKEPVHKEQLKNMPQSLPTEPACSVSYTTSTPNKTTSSPPTKPAKVIVEDEMGTIIPEPALAIWNRRHEIQELMTQVSRMRCYIEAKQAEGDILFKGITQNCVHKLNNAYSELRSAHPEVVCGSCEGRVPKTGCGSCHSTGFQCSTDYERLTAIGFKELRKADISKRKNATPRLPTTSARLNP